MMMALSSEAPRANPPEYVRVTGHSSGSRGLIAEKAISLFLRLLRTDQTIRQTPSTYKRGLNHHDLTIVGIAWTAPMTVWARPIWSTIQRATAAPAKRVPVSIGHLRLRKPSAFIPCIVAGFPHAPLKLRVAIALC